MILYLITVWVLYYFFHKFESEVRHNLWSPTKSPEQKPIPLILSGFKSQVFHLNEMNLSLCSLIDWQLKLISFRDLMIRICLSRISSVILPGLVFLTWGEWLAAFFISVIFAIIFFMRGKKWGPTLFPVALYGVFYLIAGLSVDFLKNALEASPESPVWFWLADGRFFAVLSVFGGVFLSSLLLRRQGFFFLLFLPLFLMGFVPPVNFLSVIFAETIASAAVMFMRFSPPLRVTKCFFRELLMIRIGFLLLLLFFWLFLKGTGWLEVRVMGGLWDKKLILLFLWSISEISMTAVQMLWGHFRFKSLQPDTSEVSSFVFPGINFKRDFIPIRQKSQWLEVAQVKWQNIKEGIKEMRHNKEQKFPQMLIYQSEKEVESLGSFIELMKSKS
jgi:hypothetical protein